VIDAQAPGCTFIVRDNPAPGWARPRDAPLIYPAKVASLCFLAVIIFSEQPDVSDFSNENVLRAVYNIFCKYVTFRKFFSKNHCRAILRIFVASILTSLMGM